MFLPCHCRHHWGAQALNNKPISFHSNQATLPTLMHLFKTLRISDQWCHPVGMVVSNVIMWYLDVMRCKWVLGLVPWFRCIVSLHLSLKCLLPNERVVLVDSVGGREGRWGYIDGRFQRETLADMSLKEVEGDCSSNYWCCSLMVVYELTMEAWGCRWYSLMKILGTKRWLM